MEIVRPQASEKPPVPAKPRLRPAPPRPPKPPLSSVSPTSSSTQIDNDQGHGKKSYILQNGLPKTPNPSSKTQKHAISARSTSAETLSPSSSTHVSSSSPDPSTLQPPEQRKRHKTPSSLSLPASFRNTNFNKSTINTLTTLAPSTSSSAISTSFPQRSPIRHVSPPRKVPSTTSPKPQNSFTAQSPKSAASGIVHNARQIKEDEEKFSSNGLHTMPEKSDPAEDLATHKNVKPSATVAPLCKNSAPPPQRPTSPPSRSTLCPGRPPNPPSKSSTQTSSVKPSENSSTQAGDKDSNSTEAVCPLERKLSAPPPLPKNPPRGGVPRKRRQSSFKLSPTSEIKLTLSQQTPEATEVADDSISGNTNTQIEVTADNSTQQITMHFNSQSLVQDTQGIDTKLLNDISISDTSYSNIETKLQPFESNITDNSLQKSKAKTPPKPRPRTRPSLTPNDDEGIIQQPFNVEINESDNKNITQNSIAGIEAHTASEKTTELDFVETYQGASDSLRSSDIRTNNIDTEGNISQTSEQTGMGIQQSTKNTISKHSPGSEQSDTNTSQATQNIDVTSAILITQMSPTHTDVNSSQLSQNTEDTNSVSTKPFISEPTPLVNCTDSGNGATNNSGIFDDSNSLFHEEPEATCGMLKEIEELLKNKLGDIELDLDNKSTKYSEIKSQHTGGDFEHHSATEAGTSRENNVHSLNSDNSPATSPVRPPRPKRQASIGKYLGSLESLNTSSTECLVSSGLSETTDGGKKSIPRKPKRTFLSRVSRSHSDVTGMKSIVDCNSSPDDAEEPLQEEVKPFLPPRLESLRRSESAATCQSPPPLPPRNQPRIASLKDILGAESEPPELPSRSSLSEQNSHCKTEPEVAENLDESSSSKTIKQFGSPAKVHSPARLRPARKAPPPPPGSPRRSATFSPGDSKQPNANHSSDQAGNMETTQEPASPRVKRSSSACQERPSSEVDDHCYHEISDSFKIREDSQENDETPPPVLPPRTCKTDSEGDQASFVSGTPEQQSSVQHPGDNDKYPAANSQTEMPESPKMDMIEAETKTSSPKERKQQEKMAKNALIQKVAQGLGLRKSMKVSTKVPEITLVINESNKVQADDSESEKISTSSNAVVDLLDETKDGGQASNIATENADEFIQKTLPPTDTSGSSVSVFDRPLSEVSQQSTSSEQEGSGQNMEEIVSSGTDTEPEEDKEEIYAVRKAKKVFFIAKEIVSSENTFVDVLKLLNIDFRHHISKSTENLGHTVIPAETLNKILDFLPQLQNFNEDLLKDLNERIENWETNPRLADIFVKKGPFLKLYSSYIRNFESATAVLEDAVKKNPVFASTLKEFELSPRCAKLALKHYMLKPIQRIPQYKLLLQDYLKHLLVGSLDYKDTVTALNIVSEVADHANDSMRHGDNVQKLLEIQRSLIGQFEVIQPGRVLLKQGELQKLSRKEMQPRMFFLFNDVLLYTTPATTGYKINNILPLAGMKINSPKLEDYKYEFNIISVQRSFTLSGSTSEEKEQWVTALQTAIEENAKKFHTLKTVRQGPQTSLLDKDFVLGHKAPLWVPDARVTMCMLCLLEFTLTWRRHHCRSCGRVVCSHCSENKAPLRYLKYEPARVCDRCFEKLREDMTSEYQQKQWTKKKPTFSQSEEDSFTSVSEGTEDTTDSLDGEDVISEPVKHDSGLSLNHLMSRFQKIRISNREKRKPSNFRPSVLKEVCANDEGSDMSGYLRIYRSRKWKRLWFVVKGKILYTYKASEDMAATESMPLLGYEVTRMNAWFEGAEPDLLFELTHQNNQPLTSRREGDKVSPRVVPGTEKTTQRLIFRTDSATATTKWVTVLREASLTYQ